MKYSQQRTLFAARKNSCGCGDEAQGQLPLWTRVHCVQLGKPTRLSPLVLTRRRSFIMPLLSLKAPYTHAWSQPLPECRETRKLPQASLSATRRRRREITPRSDYGASDDPRRTPSKTTMSLFKGRPAGGASVSRAWERAQMHRVKRKRALQANHELPSPHARRPFSDSTDEGSSLPKKKTGSEQHKSRP